jgi:hypothetical protein
LGVDFVDALGWLHIRRSTGITVRASSDALCG